MDLGTVRDRLATGLYSSPNSFVEDVRLTFANAMTYNPQGHDVSVRLASSSVAQAKPRPSDIEKRPMTFEEKQKLSINLETLPGDKLERIVQIIKKRNPDVGQNEDEIEVDIDSFDNDTLWELDQFITNCMKSRGKKKTTKKASKKAQN
ncbi:unnamed protein product, partial [Sphagnum troendelagicum]